jgi:hypothetical protein
MVCDFLAKSLINVLHGTLFHSIQIQPRSPGESHFGKWKFTGGVGALVHSNENLFDQYGLLLLN